MITTRGSFSKYRSYHHHLIIYRGCVINSFTRITSLSFMKEILYCLRNIKSTVRNLLGTSEITGIIISSKVASLVYSLTEAQTEQLSRDQHDLFSLFGLAQPGMRSECLDGSSYRHHHSAALPECLTLTFVLQGEHFSAPGRHAAHRNRARRASEVFFSVLWEIFS